MVPATKWKMPILPQTMATNGTVAGFVDTLGYDFAEITFAGPTHAATNIPTVLKLTCGTSTVASSNADIVAFTGATVTSAAAGYVIPASTTVVTAGYAVKMLVNMQPRERYLGLVYTPTGGGASHMLTATAHLSRGKVAPDTATLAGLTGLVTEQGLLT